MRAFPLDGVMVTPIFSKFPRAVYRVTNPLEPHIHVDVCLALDRADPNVRLHDALRAVITDRLHREAKLVPSWKIALANLVRPE